MVFIAQLVACNVIEDIMELLKASIASIVAFIAFYALLSSPRRSELSDATA